MAYTHCAAAVACTLAGESSPAEGTLRATGKGSRLKIECGSFYDLLGQPVPVVPDYGWEFEVLPDHRKDEVERRNRDHAFIRQLLDRGACRFELPLDVESPLMREVRTDGFNSEVARVVALAVRTGVQENWRELRAIEIQLESITEAFGGGDVLHPRPRQQLDQAKSRLVDLHEKVQEYTGPFDLPEPDDDVRGALQKAVDREVRNVPTT